VIGASRRRRDGPDRFLYAKVALFFLGAGFFFAGVVTGRDWAVGVAVAVLFMGVLLRLAPGRRDESAGDADE
jgi:hypothetical protein